MTQNINGKLLEPKSEFIMLSDCLKEGNVIWDQDTTSPYNINTTSHQQVMRIKKISIRGLLVDPIPKSPNRRIVLQTAGRIGWSRNPTQTFPDDGFLLSLLPVNFVKVTSNHFRGLGSQTTWWTPCDKQNRSSAVINQKTMNNWLPKWLQTTCSQCWASDKKKSQFEIMTQAKNWIKVEVKTLQNFLSWEKWFMHTPVKYWSQKGLKKKKKILD